MSDYIAHKKDKRISLGFTLNKVDSIINYAMVEIYYP